MNDIELIELIKKDASYMPDIKWDSKEILRVSKEKEKKNRRKISRFVCSLSVLSFIFVVVFSVILINKNNNIKRINNSIENLVCIKSNEDRMIEIMKIDREIKLNYQNSLSKISIDELELATYETVKQLKQSFEWENTLEQDEDYKELSEYFSLYNSYEIYMIRSAFSSIYEVIHNKNIINELLSYFDLPFTEVVMNRETFFEDYKEELSGSYKDFYSISLKYYEMDENESVRIDVFGSGYVFVVINERIGDETYDVINKYLLVSLVPIDYDEFSEFVSYENLNKILGD